MRLSRRELLRQLGAAAGAVTAAHLIGRGVLPAGRAEAAALSTPDFRALAGEALRRAELHGCAYAGVRFDCRREASVSWLPAAGDGAGRFADVTEAVSLGVSVRVLHSDVMGYAEGSVGNEREVALVAERAVADARAKAARGVSPSSMAPKNYTHAWVAPPQGEPTRLSRQHGLAFRRAVVEAVRPQGGAAGVGSSLTIRGEETYFVSTRGECSRLTRVWAA